MILCNHTTHFSNEKKEPIVGNSDVLQAGKVGKDSAERGRNQ